MRSEAAVFNSDSFSSLLATDKGKELGSKGKVKTDCSHEKESACLESDLPPKQGQGGHAHVTF